MNNNSYNFDNAKQENNPLEFKRQAISYALEELKNKHLINDDEAKKLQELYEKDSRDIKEIFYEIKNLTREEIEKKLTKEKAQKAPQENKISIDNVDDFQNQMKTKNLIKIHYPYPSDEVKVVENYSGKSAKELFEAAKDKDGLVSVDGFVSSVDVSKDYIEPDKIEVKLHNVTDLARRGEFSKLSYKEKECVIGLVSSIVNELSKCGDISKEELSRTPVDRLVIMLNKNIFISPEENIVILCTENEPTKDEIMAVTKNADGKYELENLKIDNNEKEIGGNTGDATSKEKPEMENENTLENDKENGTSMRKKAPWERRMAS